MKTRNKNRGRWVALLLCAAFGCAVAVGASAESTITKSDGTILKVKSARWVQGQNGFTIMLADGSSQMIPKAVIESIDMEKPQKLILAESQLRSQQYDAAIMALESVMAEYQRLGWDMIAAERVADVYTRVKKDPRKAVAALEKVLRDVPKADISAGTQLAYWNTLLAQGRGSDAILKKELDESIALGQRDLVAAAYVARGGLNQANGQREAALLDYLRVVILFENVKNIQPEALYRASSVLDEMKDKGGRGDILRRKLLELYPDSPYADEARKKMG
ncbi:MAG: hypothetical protein WCL44_05150 [bacterium]